MPGPLREPPPHGTRQRYQWRRGKCRCEACKLANWLYVASWRVKRARSGTDQPLPFERERIAAPRRVRRA